MTQANPAPTCEKCGKVLCAADIALAEQLFADNSHHNDWCSDCLSPRGTVKEFIVALRTAEKRRRDGRRAAKPSALVELSLYDAGVWDRDRTADENDRQLWFWLHRQGIQEP